MESYETWRVTDCDVIIGELRKYDVAIFFLYLSFKWRVTKN